MKLDPRMAEALALVRAGRPMEATHLLRTITGGPADAPTPQPSAGDGAGPLVDMAPLNVSTKARPAPARPASPQTAEQVFRSRHGELTYRLHRPAHLPAGAPLLMMLHGCTQDAADFARGTRMNALAEAQGMAVLWPTQSPRSNPRRCWRWFEAAHQGPETGEPALLLALAREVAEAHALDPHALHVAGLSAGGAMAAVLAACAPDLVAAVAVHSGLAAGVAGTMAGGLAAMQRAPAAAGLKGPFVPMLILHGDADGIVAPSNADLLFEGAVARAAGPLHTRDEATAHGRLTTARDAGGHVRVARLMIAGAVHAWSGGDPAGSHTSAAGPDASAEILRFFAVQRENPPRGL